MLGADYMEKMQHEGFRLIGSLDYRLHLSAWWNAAADKLIELIIFDLGSAKIIKGNKSYYLKSITAAGETWARDIGPLHDYLEGHFPELRISFSHFRDVPAGIAQAEVHRRSHIEAPTPTVPTVEEMGLLQRQLATKSQNIQSSSGMFSLLSRPSDLLGAYMRQNISSENAEIDQLQQHIERQQQRLGVLQHLQREYQRKGSAAVYTISISSNLQVAETRDQFCDAVHAVVKELTDMHRYQVKQKLGGGRLNIQVEETTEPAMSWVEQWLGGALSPAQVERLGPLFEEFRKVASGHVTVTPDEAITVDEHVRHAGKHLAAHVVSDLVQRLDKTGAATQNAALSPENVLPESLPLSLGWRVDDAGNLVEPVSFPLTQMLHVYISGTTGSGKSFLARVLIEEAAQFKNLNILVLDPRNQSIGILVPENRPKILEEYKQFKMRAANARAFQFQYFAPGLPYATPLPTVLQKLASGRSIVSFKDLDDEQRCAHAAKILDAAFETYSGQESDVPKLLIVVDEAQLFTRKRSDDSAKEAATRVERSLDRIAREGRKFGIVLALVSQTIKDFAYEMASVRQMTTTKIFLRNSDREIEYANDIIGEGRQLIQLPTGTAILHNAHWGLVRLRVRPPYSKVFELGSAEVRQLVGSKASSRITTDAQHLLAAIKKASSSEKPLNMSKVSQLAGITSKRRVLDLIDELERAGAIHTRKLMERGQPRVIELIGNAEDEFIIK